MGNERLRSQMNQAGLTVGELARQVEVDPKTVERWLDIGRLPHQRHRQKAANLLASDETFLWPQLLDDERSRATSEAELISFYPHRGAVPPDLWRRLVETPTERVEILVYAGLFLIDSHPDLPDKLAERASDGLQVRLLYGDPESDTVAWRATRRA